MDCLELKLLTQERCLLRILPPAAHNAAGQAEQEAWDHACRHNPQTLPCFCAIGDHGVLVLTVVVVVVVVATVLAVVLPVLVLVLVLIITVLLVLVLVVVAAVAVVLVILVHNLLEVVVPQGAMYGRALHPQLQTRNPKPQIRNHTSPAKT